MSDHAAFLKAIIDHADQDGPRLAYADWLEEHGDPRGEFIRTQIETAPDGAPYSELIHAAGAAALARSRTLRRLTELGLEGNAIGDGGLASLAGSPTLARLEWLDLTNNEVGLAGDEALERLCESPHL